MPSYSTNEFKSGLKILIDREPYTIIHNEFVKPGKGQAFNRVKLRNLKNQRVIEKTYKSGESVEAADVMEYDMTYLYNDDAIWYFMNSSTFEQLEVRKAVVDDQWKWLKEQEECTVVLWNDEAISIEAPNFVVLQVTECEPGIKGDSVSNVTKSATLETGVEVRLPLFINSGDWVKMDTRTGSYVSRSKDA